MSTSPKTTEEKQALNDRLKSLRINRQPLPATSSPVGSPKKLLLVISVLVALVAVAYAYFSAAPKTVAVAEVKTENGAASGATALTVSGYVVAHHKIAVGAKVMGRVAWIGVEKGDTVQEGQVLVRLEDSEFRAQVNQAQANLAAAQARLDRLRTGSRPEEKLKDKAAVLQAEANLKNAEAEYQRTDSLYRSGVSSKAEYDRALANRDSAAAQLQAAR